MGYSMNKAEKKFIRDILNKIYKTEEVRDKVLNVYKKINKIINTSDKQYEPLTLLQPKEPSDIVKLFGMGTTAMVRDQDFQTHNLWASIVSKIMNNQKDDMTEQEDLFIRYITYLIYVEGIYSYVVNILCYLLANQTEPPKGIGKINMDDITRDVRLFIKLKYLKDNGFAELADACDRDLRNAVGHNGGIFGDPKMKTDHQATASSEKIKNWVEFTGSNIYIRRKINKKWQWDKNPININDAMSKIISIVNIYRGALSLWSDVHSYRNPLVIDYRIWIENGRYAVAYKWAEGWIYTQRNPLPQSQPDT